MVTLKAIIIDAFVLGLIAWSIIQFLHYKEEGRIEKLKN